MNKEKKEYLGSKYSEQVFGDAGASLSQEEKSRQENQFQPSNNFEENLLWKQIDSENYNKTQTLSTNF
jgi:hypothetical protein